MDKQENKQERSFELRSEKVRSIVGQIPSALIRYGITAIGAVLLCLLAVAYFPFAKNQEKSKRKKSRELKK